MSVVGRFVSVGDHNAMAGETSLVGEPLGPSLKSPGWKVEVMYNAQLSYDPSLSRYPMHVRVMRIQCALCMIDSLLWASAIQ